MTAELNASRRDSTLILTMVNPGLNNALDSDMLAAAIETLSKVERDDDICSIIITGADRNFCGGINANKELATQLVVLEHLQNLIETLRSFPKPVIAAVEGTAIDGAFSLALTCDFIVAGQTASFGISSAQVGTWAIGGAPWLLSNKLPAQWLSEILLDAKPLPAARLYQAGLVNKLVADGSVLDQALAWAAQLATLPDGAFEQLKTVLGNASNTTLNQHFTLEKHALLTKRPGQH